MKKNKGFTLIELLVVIAIIGILSSVVLASLNSARSKGNDAAIKENLNNTRAQAALYYDSHNGYTTAAVTAVATPTVAGCTTAGSLFDSAAADGIYSMVLAADKAAGGTGITKALCGISVGTVAVPAASWIISVPISTGHYWCVDSTGSSKDEASAPGASYICA